jgi:ethanolamine utilization protein EutJ
MSKEMTDFTKTNKLIADFEAVIAEPRLGSKEYYIGVDLGTAFVVTAVMDENGNPVAGACEYADVVRDGMVVDYIRAVDIVRRMKGELEEKLDAELVYAAAALPPGTEGVDGGAVKNVVLGAGYELIAVTDEPTAANALLGIRDGAVVDIGGGTTGISVLRDGEVVYLADEATGGTHFSLVVAGAYNMSFGDAELYKRNPENHKELLPVLRPVVEKVASIITRHTRGFELDELALVGGACCLSGIEEIISKETGIPARKPANPMLVTPLGIASCALRQAHSEKNPARTA